jgi:hypothetical protein
LIIQSDCLEIINSLNEGGFHGVGSCTDPWKIFASMEHLFLEGEYDYVPRNAVVSPKSKAEAHFPLLSTLVFCTIISISCSFLWCLIL